MNQSPKKWTRGLSVLAGICAAAAALSAGAESIVTGGKTGTYYAIGSNLRDFVNPALEVKDSKGSWANVEDMSRTKGVTLAIVQSDVYSAFVQLRDSKEVPEATRREYAQLLANLRVFMPLYKEEIHFLARKDDPIEFIHQIKGRPLWMDMEKSGTYLTALNIYSKLFQERPNAVEPFINTTATGEDEGTRRRRSALMALSDPAYYKAYPKIDVMVLVGGQPLGLLEKNLPPNLKLLKFDPAQPGAARVLQDYQKAAIQKSSYPLLNIAGSESPSLAVDSYLITANFADPQRNQYIKDFADQFCTNFSVLQERGHAKWKSLTWQPGSSLPPVATGWQYSDKVKERLAGCRISAAAATAAKPSACSPQDRVTGLCR
ncbi:TAXI family TRAP transporter solute-binding subunit [Polaromonas hydrogenivorans]|uniref:TAXI family TRAP transporter solute-binding subunit n=1 Tax=Polaromonas hydrogenivorans TaxID=335476 RepID=A0AAU7LTT9_9BURK